MTGPFLIPVALLTARPRQTIEPQQVGQVIRFFSVMPRGLDSFNQKTIRPGSIYFTQVGTCCAEIRHFRERVTSRKILEEHG